LFFFLVSPLVAQETAQIVLRSEISNPNPVLRSAAEEQFRDFTNKPLDEAEVASRIRRFHETHSVYLIRITSRREGKGIVLQIHVEDKPLIGEIVFKGNRTLSSEDLLTRMELTAGDSFTPQVLEQIGGRLQEYYRLRGFPDAKVKLASRAMEESTKSTVLVEIVEGQPCKIETLEFRVAKNVLGDKQTKALLDMKSGDRCDLQKVVTGSNAIRNSLKEMGRLSSQVDDPEATFTPDRKSANLMIAIRPGPKLDIHFLGNTFFWERDSVLEEAIGIADERQFNRSWIEATAIQGIKDFYLRLGYPQADVKVKDFYDHESDTRTLLFHIQRGPKIRIGEIAFQGVHALSETDVEKSFWASATETLNNDAYVAEDVSSAAQGILAFYQSKGYLRAQIDEPRVKLSENRQQVALTFALREGALSKLEKYDISGNTVFTESQITRWMTVKPGDPINPVLMSGEAEKIAARYKAKGYKFAALRIPKVETIPAGDVVYKIAVEEGKKVTIGSISVRGNLNTLDYVVRRELKIKEGEAYSPENLRETRRSLLKLGFFRQVALDEVNYDPTTGREDLVITVEERKKRSVRIRPGFSSDEGFRGALDLAYINIGGTGRSANIGAQVSKRVFDVPGQATSSHITAHREVFTYREPWFLNLAQGRVNFINERADEQQFNIDRQSIILGLDRDFYSWFRGTLQWELEHRNPFDILIPKDQLSPIDQTGALFGSIAAIVDFDFRDDLLNPTKGTFHRVRFDIFNKQLISDADFVQFTVRNTFFYPIYKRVRIVTAVRAGISSTYGQTPEAAIPLEKRFRLGGNTSLRGFSRNCVGGLTSNLAENCPKYVSKESGVVTVLPALGGNAMFNYMVDFIFPLFGDLDMALFTDGGNAYPLNRDLFYDFFSMRNTAGFGFRYNTFFGPLRLDLGFPLDRRDGEPKAQVSFAVGQF
jgi:outer membrane protein insertion porin family